MRFKNPDLSPHGKKVLELLHKSAGPLTAYQILDKLGKHGIKAPPTVYRALDSLMQRGLVHRIESLNAFVACDSDEQQHGTQFAVCRSCGNVVEIHDHTLSAMLNEIGRSIKFHVEREMLELLGLCQNCVEA